MRLGQATRHEEPFIPNELVKSGRIGKFAISFNVFMSLNVADCLKIMGHFVVIKAKYYSWYDKVEYVAYSPLFDCVSEGEEIPEYAIVVEFSDDGFLTVVARRFMDAAGGAAWG